MAAYIELKLFASLKTYLPQGAERFPIQAGETVEALMKRLGIPLGEVNLIFVNGVKAQMSSILGGGDRVGIFPPVGGG
ncbi:MAG: MoaD/ThiS family protein [Thermodesulfobacteriota bacterium]|nr:MoaD/ThiS family protein [Thermodesulfobacteriota bacterium]